MRAEARRGADTTRTTQATADMTDEQVYWEAMAQEEQLMADDEQIEAAAYWDASNHDTRTGERNSGGDRRPQASDTEGAATGVGNKARARTARAAISRSRPASRGIPAADPPRQLQAAGPIPGAT